MAFLSTLINFHSGFFFCTCTSWTHWRYVLVSQKVQQPTLFLYLSHTLTFILPPIAYTLSYFLFDYYSVTCISSMSFECYFKCWVAEKMLALSPWAQLFFSCQTDQIWDTWWWTWNVSIPFSPYKRFKCVTNSHSFNVIDKTRRWCDANFPRTDEYILF